ncbi:ATPase, vacuolar ER assembly factor, Vma12 [Rostrohypoxylon terebratum]|nr:ATPase, vacuolar ER assembly factor, Vma12 [Rostrohypoxylon terebratum]
MVLLTMTPSIVEAIKILEGCTDDILQDNENNSNFKGDGEPSLKDPELGKPVSHGQIVDIWKRLKHEKVDATRLEELLRGATVYIPPPPPKPEPTDEYKALMTRLRREEEERAYERMLKKAPPKESFARRFPHAPMAHSFAEVNRPTKASDIGDDIEHGDIQKQVTLVINFLLSIFGAGAALWIAARWWSIPARLFLSLGGSIIVAIAEVAVYSAYTWRMAEGEKVQNRKKEIKEIVQTWVIGEDDHDKKGYDEPLKLDEAEPATNPRRRTKELQEKTIGRERPLRTYSKRAASTNVTEPVSKKRCFEKTREIAETKDEAVEPLRQSSVSCPSPTLPPSQPTKKGSIMNYFKIVQPMPTSSLASSEPTSEPTKPATTPPSSPPVSNRNRKKRRLTTRIISRATSEEPSLDNVIEEDEDSDDGRDGSTAPGGSADVLSDTSSNTIGQSTARRKIQLGAKKQKRKNTPKPSAIQTTLSLSMSEKGFTECKECHMIYNPLHKQDAQFHSRRHATMLKAKSTIRDSITSD